MDTSRLSRLFDIRDNRGVEYWIKNVNNRGLMQVLKQNCVHPVCTEVVAEAVYKVDFRSGSVNREYIPGTFPL